MNLFKDLQQDIGCSYVIVAHDLGTTRYMADRIAVMYLGKLVEIGPTGMMFTSPEHP
jgi:peptide/nickel transport system ATP-binding protein/oligopeptide transport system ATP-binding protein